MDVLTNKPAWPHLAHLAMMPESRWGVITSYGAGLAATFAAIFVAVLVWMYEKDGRKKYKWLFGGMMLSAMLFALNSMTALLEIPNIGTAIEWQNGLTAILSSMGAIVVAFISLIAAPSPYRIEQKRQGEQRL